jgi:hypothetical protein
MGTPKSSKFKVAFTGTNSSGKTTMALGVTARLKLEHVLAEVVSSQDRKITWKDDHFPVNPIAHYGMVTNMIHAEVQAQLKGDADIVITDRSALDLYSIACTDFPNDPMIADLNPTVLAWMKTYTKVYYLPPLDYQEDGKRPPDSFRMRTHATLLRLIESLKLPNLVMVTDRTTVYKEIRELLNLPPKKHLSADPKWQAIARRMRSALLVKEPSDMTPSDFDVWLCLKDNEYADPYSAGARKLFDEIKLFFGNVKCDLMFMPDSIRNSLDTLPPDIKFHDYK